MSDEVLMLFGEKIRSLRIEKGLSQEKLAELTGFHRTYISLVERGKRNISLKNIVVFADFFDLELSQIF